MVTLTKQRAKDGCALYAIIRDFQYLGSMLVGTTGVSVCLWGHPDGIRNFPDTVSASDYITTACEAL